MLVFYRVFPISGALADVDKLETVNYKDQSEMHKLLNGVTYCSGSCHQSVPSILHP